MSASDIIRTPPTANADWSQPLRRGGLAAVVALLGTAGWMAVAPLDSAVIAPGSVAAEGSKQTVQHLEGGIIREINVRDGQLVRRGEVLFIFEDTQARAMADTLTAQVGVHLAKEARLLAERELADEINFPEEVLKSGNAAVRRALGDEEASFRERRDLRKVQNEVLENKIATLRREIQGLASEEKASEEQLALVDQELPGLRSLLTKGLVALGRVTALERERVRLISVASRSVTDSAKAERAIGEVEMQIVQANVDFQRGAVNDLIDIRRLLSEARDRLGVARDVLSRLDIRAPQTGVAQDRRFTTVGAVVKPGEPMVDIAPVDQELVVRVQVLPKDIDQVRVGQVAEVRFPNFKNYEAPILKGTVRALSNDRILDPTTAGTYYFFVEVVTEAKGLPDDVRERIRTGMSVEVIFPTGERTAATYIIQPITERLRRALLER